MRIKKKNNENQPLKSAKFQFQFETIFIPSKEAKFKIHSQFSKLKSFKKFGAILTENENFQQI